ncbi:uncharacterized protein [Primulina eburnea]|uniref:uncharacterized protein isoform X3 n=1 Tax=Primulina eburnea TaxID=1245227 RepID=UPI003C6BD8D9
MEQAIKSSDLLTASELPFSTRISQVIFLIPNPIYLLIDGNPFPNYFTMALIFPSRAISVPGSQNHAFSCPRSGLRFCTSAARMRVESGAVERNGAAIVWYKHDLRVEDHIGLVAAAKHHCVVPLYIFDRRILSRFSDEMLEILLFALEDLRKLLKEQGSNLMIRTGNAENVIRHLVEEVKASTIFVEEELEYGLCTMVDNVKETLSSVSFAEWNPEIMTWNTPFYDIKSLKDFPASYDDFRRLKLIVASALLPPKLSLPEMNLSWGALPTLDEVKKFGDDDTGGGRLRKEWTAVKKLSAEDMLQRGKFFGLEQAELLENKQQVLSDQSIQRRPEKSAFVTQQGNLVGGGVSLVLNALAAYLRYLEGTSRDDFQEVHVKLRQAEKREGASFQVLFGSALLLGIISRRRVYHEAVKYENERNGGFSSPFGYSAAVTAAIATVSSMEWYWLLNLHGQRCGAGNYGIRIWRWNNHLIQYTVAGCEGPAILLVHGFGAFLEHYRDNINPIAEAGNRVWAITLIGFGKSEKPNIVYTELAWAELLRDFIIDVVGEPVHLIGNSIGGYFAAIVAGLWSPLAKSVGLMNSAGNIVPQYTTPYYSVDRRTSGAGRLGAKLLLPYLRFNIRNILKRFYPKKTDRADAWLINEMVRASYDPGVTYVLQSIFSFDLSLPLNFLLEGFDNRILVIQGMNDPLNDSKSKLAMFKKHCRGVVTKEICAGHCPHDEEPNEVNRIIKEWVATLESRRWNF